MSAYKRGGVYWYDFWFRGIRYRESTGLTNKNAATDAESIRRVSWQKAGQELCIGIPFRSSRTL